MTSTSKGYERFTPEVYAHSMFDAEYIDGLVDEARKNRAARIVHAMWSKLPPVTEPVTERVVLLAAPKPMRGYRSDEISKVPQLAVVYEPTYPIAIGDNAPHNFQIHPFGFKKWIDLRHGMNEQLYDTLTERAETLGLPIPAERADTTSLTVHTAALSDAYRPAVPVS